MIPVNPLDVTILFKPDTEKHTSDELKHVLEYLPDILKEMIRQHETETQE